MCGLWRAKQEIRRVVIFTTFSIVPRDASPCFVMRMIMPLLSPGSPGLEAQERIPPHTAADIGLVPDDGSLVPINRDGLAADG